MTPFLIVVGVVLAAAAGFWLKRPRKAQDEPVFYFNCTGCRRKLRYRARQVGHSGQCPSCKKDLVFPRP